MLAQAQSGCSDSPCLHSRRRQAPRKAAPRLQEKSASDPHTQGEDACKRAST